MSDDIVGRRLTAPVGYGNGAGLAEIVRVFLRLGVTAFGGPAAHVPLMEDEVVTRRQWMSRSTFLDHYGVVQLLPGPNSTELAVHLGHARAGWRGGVLAGLCFVIPAVAMVWALAALSSTAGLAPYLTNVTRVLTPVVVGLLVSALWAFGTQAWSRPGAAIVMPVTALLTVALRAPDPLVLVAGAASAMLVAGRRWPSRATLLIVAGGSALAAGTLVFAQQAGSPPSAVPGFLAILVHFLRAGLSVFGSGYVLFAWLQHDLVADRHWLTLPALTHASALAQVTPGPLFTTATAAGFAIAGHAGALAATIGIFAPAFLSVPLGPPLRRLVERHAILRQALDGVVIASVALLGRAVCTFASGLRGWQWGVLAVSVVLLAGRRVPGPVLLLSAVAFGIVDAFLHLVPT